MSAVILHALALQNFKCFKDLTLTFSDITLLSGLNGSGKSSVIQSILLLRQSYSSGDLRRGTLDLGGNLVNLGTGQDVLHVSADSDDMMIGLSWSDNKQTSFAFSYDKDGDQAAYARSGFDPLSTEDAQNRAPFNAEFHYVCAERVGPRLLQPLSASRATARDIGSHGEFVFQFLLAHGNTMLAAADPRAINADGLSVNHQVAAWLREISPGVILSLEQIRAADGASASFSFEKANDVPTRGFRPTNVGFGLSYALPIIVALVAAPPGSLVILENPEAHVHPRGQTRFGQLASLAASAGVQVLIETHSDHFLDGIRRSIRSKELDANTAAFYFFERNFDTVEVTKPVVDARGRMSSWPVGFFDQHERNLVELLAPNKQG